MQLNDPDNIRDALTEDEITATNRQVKFVTLKAYEKAGGAVAPRPVRKDDDGVFILDIVLLDSLVAKKLEKTAAAIRKEGWKWVEVRGSFDYPNGRNANGVIRRPRPSPPIFRPNSTP